MGQLIVEKVADAAAAHGKVGVHQAGPMRVDDLGEPVGKSSKADGVVAVPEALGLTVTYRDISGVPRHNATLVAKCVLYLRCSRERRQFVVPLGHVGPAVAQNVDHA